MTPTKKTIRLTGIICAITFVLTFLVCLNISYQWFDIKWLSNTFQLTILGGIFASSAVVLFCEIQKYRMNKRSMEDTLWSNTTLLYVKSIVVKHKLDNLIQCPNQPVSAGLFDECKTDILSYWGWVNTIDYAPYKKNNLRTAFTKFQRKDSLQITSRVQDFSVFNIAVNTSEIKRRTNNPPQSPTVTAADPIVVQTILNLNDGINEVLSLIENLLKAIDYSGRYEHDKMLTTVKEKYNELTDFDFEKFLQRK